MVRISIFLAVLSKRVSTGLEKFLGEKLRIVWFFRTLREDFPNFAWNFLRLSCQNCVLRVQKIILQNKFLAGLSKVHSTCPVEHFGKEFFGKIHIISQYFLDIQRNIFGFWAKPFRQSCRNCILRIWSKNLSEFCFRKLCSWGSGNWLITEKKVSTLLKEWLSFRNFLRRKLTSL